jgi:hypothetical protein
VRERAFAAGGVMVVAICCGGPALIGGLLGGVAIAAVVRTAALALLGLGLVAAVAVFVVRRRRCHYVDCVTSQLPGNQGAQPR